MRYGTYVLAPQVVGHVGAARHERGPRLRFDRLAREVHREPDLAVEKQSGRKHRAPRNPL